MAERNDPSTHPEHLLHLKNELLARWRQLPDEHQATMMLTLLSDVLDGEYRVWMLDALSLAQTAETALTDDLLDEETQERLPLPFTVEGESFDALAQAKFVLPGDNRTWYVSAYDGQDICFGLVVETDMTFDYFSLSELRALRGADEQPVCRDLNFQPTRLRTLQNRYQRGR